MEIFRLEAGPYKTNCYTVVHEHQATVIDPAMFVADHILAASKEHQFSVDKIVLTHGHIDHIRDAGTLAAHWDVPVFIHPDDAFMLEDLSAWPEQTKLLFDVSAMTPIRDLQFLQESISIGGDLFQVLHAPGHSPGSVILVGQEITFAGDVVFKGAIGRTDLPFSDPQAMNATLREVVMSIPDEHTVLPGHGPEFLMKLEKNTNPFLVGL